MIAEKRFILKKLISPFSIKIRNVSMKMIVLMKEDPTINVPKEIFRTPIFTVRSSDLELLCEIGAVEMSNLKENYLNY